MAEYPDVCGELRAAIAACYREMAKASTSEQKRKRLGQVVRMIESSIQLLQAARSG